MGEFLFHAAFLMLDLAPVNNTTASVFYMPELA